jgi:hypothetical protein
MEESLIRREKMNDQKVLEEESVPFIKKWKKHEKKSMRLNMKIYV